MTNKTIGALSADLNGVTQKFNQLGLQLFHINDKIIYPIHAFATLAYRLAEYPLGNYIDKTSVSSIDKICDELDRYVTMTHDLVFQVQHRLETVIDALETNDNTDNTVISDIIELLSSLKYTANRGIATIQVARGHAHELVLELENFLDYFTFRTSREELSQELDGEVSQFTRETRDQLEVADQASTELATQFKELEELVPELERTARATIKALSHDE